MSLNSNVIIVGIGGCSRSGKTILVEELKNQYLNINKQNSYIDICDSIHLDTYANWNKVKQNRVKTNYGNIYDNWEFPGSIDWDIFYEDIEQKINKINTKIKNIPNNSNKKGILFVEGFVLFTPLMSNSSNNNKYLNLFDYYIFICLDKKLAKIRRMKTTRVPDDYYEEILWPEYIKNCSNHVEFFTYQKVKNNKKVLIIDGNKEYNLKYMALCILKWMNVFNNSNLIDQNTYNSLFTSFDLQLNLIKKSLSSH